MVEKALDLKEKVYNKEYSLNIVEAMNLVVDSIMEHHTARDNKLDKTLLYLINKIEKAPKFTKQKEYRLALKQLNEVKDLIDMIINEVKFVRTNLSDESLE